MQFWRNAELLAVQLEEEILNIMGFWSWGTVWSQQQLEPAETLHSKGEESGENVY